MDQEKPQPVASEIYKYHGGAQHTSLVMSDLSPDNEDTLYGRTPSINEPDNVEEKRERRGESLWRVLSERHISMIVFSGTIGNGLFLGSGRSLAKAGPGGAVMCYMLMGTVISSVISCLGEMTALMPVNAPVMEFPRRFLDRGVGFAVGWMYWFAYAVIAAEEITAVSNTMDFRYDDARTFLNWPVGQNIDPAVWITLFLALVIIINMFPVKYFGELEYVFGCFKIIFIVMLILMMLIIDVHQPNKNAYYGQPLGTKYWDAPFSFFNSEYHAKGLDGSDKIIKGATGRFLGMWTGIVGAIFSYVGMDIVAATAAESKSLADAESMKMASRKISIRIISLYSMCMIVTSFVVPRNHPFINGGGQSVGSHSLFVIAAVEAGLPVAAHFMNAVFVFSSFTCAINAMYVSSRVLHALALRDQTGPEFITRRLRQCHNGVPNRAVSVTAFIMLLAYMGRTGAPGERLGELASNCTVSFLIVYLTICATYLCFFRTLNDFKLYGNASEAQAASYDRNHPRYPYKSHGQWLKACYGLVTCTLLVIFNGVHLFVAEPFDTRRFIASYISVPVFIFLIVGYKFRKHGWDFRKWGPERSDDLRNTVQASSEKRKGRLELPDEGLTGDNVRTFVNWLWVWIK